MVDQSINALLARGVGPAMVEGAHAGYYQSKTQQEADAERRRLEAEPDIAPALSGDKAAFGRVAAKDPKSAALLSTEMGRLGTAERQKHLDAIEWSGRWADALLKASPSERPAMWQAMRQQGTQLGHDLTGTPENYDPSLEPTIRTIRNTAPTYVKNQQAIDLKKTPPGKSAGVGGGGNGEVWGEPGPQSSAAPPGAGSAMADAGPPVAPAAAPDAQPPPAAAPVQTASAAPAGWQAMGHRDPQGNLVPAMMDGKPVYRNVQTGQLTSQPPVQTAQGPAPDEVPALSSGAAGEGGVPGGALPPGVQVAQAGPPQAAKPPMGGTRVSPKVVYDDPALQGGLMGRAPTGAHGKMEIIEGPGNTAIYKMPDGSFQAWKPGLKNPGVTERPLPPQGYQWGPDGGQTPIPGGPADPAVLERNTAAKRTAAEKAIPPKPAEGMQGNLNALKQLDRGEALLEKTPGSVGGPGSVAASIVPGAGWLQNRIDKEGVQLRALIADIGSMKIHERSGAAVTASEFPRLRPFIPTIADDEATVRDKLANFRAELEEHMRDVESYYGPDNGFKAYKPAVEYLQGERRGQPGAPSASPQTTAGPKAGTIESGYRFKGGDPSKQENWEKAP